MDVNDGFDSVIESSTPYLIRQISVAEWPVTTLLDSRALLYEYKIMEESIGILGKMESLFSWKHPDLPEDLTFYTNENIPWLVTTAHESYAWIDIGALPQVDHRELLHTLWANGQVVDKKYP